jgi:dTDP-4-amino-4,6-dideoxygalactose transaminase
MRLFETKISPYYAKKDIADVIESGELGFGSNVTKFETLFAPYSYKKHNIAVNSCSAAAFIIFSYLKDKYGSCDVFTPSIGFTSMAWAAKHHGHNVIFVEVDSNMLMDAESYEKERRYRCERYSDGGIKPVIMPVLYGGVSDHKRLTEEIESGGYNEFVILDSAHCATPTMKSDVSLFSFHPYKPIAASDGGMISTDIEEIDEYSRSYRNFGRKNTSDGYEISTEGFKFYMNNLNATIALTQLEVYEENRLIRKENFDHLKSLNLPGNLLDHDENSSYYVATLIADTTEIAKDLREKYCSDRLYPPLHRQKYYYDIEFKIMPKTEEIYDRLVNIPLYQKIEL